MCGCCVLSSAAAIGSSCGRIIIQHGGAGMTCHDTRRIAGAGDVGSSRSSSSNGSSSNGSSSVPALCSVAYCGGMCAHVYLFRRTFVRRVEVSRVATKLTTGCQFMFQSACNRLVDWKKANLRWVGSGPCGVSAMRCRDRQFIPPECCSADGAARGCSSSKTYLER